jgi:hypothetical protein
MSGSTLPPVQQILKEIEPYSQRMGIAVAIFALITIWFITCKFSFELYMPKKGRADIGSLAKEVTACP